MPPAQRMVKFLILSRAHFMWTLSPKSYKTGFAVLFAILVGIGITSYIMSDRFTTSEEQVIHTHEVILELKSAFTDAVEAEDSRQGFVMTGDNILLIDYDDATRRIPGHLKKLR